MPQLQKTRIGFIGLGAMGKPMAANIAKASFPLTVFDVREEPLAEMQKLGVKVVNSAKELGKKSDTVVVVVRTYPPVKPAVFPPEGVLGGMQSGSTLIVASTISPLEIMEVEKIAKERSVAVLDAPVSGGTAGNISTTWERWGKDKP
jgi:3-hydroxyisobutyrate dehydrogenase-like beta-hydroxyacid dehydrogenase